MMNGKEYLKTLKAMKTVLYIDGEEVSDFASHPAISHLHPVPAYRRELPGGAGRAKPDEARQILGLKGIDKVNY